MGAVAGLNQKKSFRQKLKEVKLHPFLYLMALPGVVFFLLFSYLPMYGILIAFKDFNISKGIMKSPWVGFANFEFFFTSNQLFAVIRNTLLLNVLFIVFTTLFALAVALLLNEITHKRFKKTTQSLIFLPYFMSWIVIGMIVQSILGGSNPTMNDWLHNLGMAPVNWAYEARLWPWILTIIRIWHGAGYASIIYLAAITGISEDVYEAARIDEASRLQIMLRITLPLLIPTISILTLLSVGKIFYGDFGMIYAIIGDNSMLFSTTDVIDTYVYRALRVLNDFGMASAVGLFQSVMGFAFVISVNLIVRRFSKESALF